MRKYIVMAMLLASPAMAEQEPGTISEEKFRELSSTKFDINDVGKFLKFCTESGGVCVRACVCV
jgi:hypothetical protein